MLLFLVPHAWAQARFSVPELLTWLLVVVIADLIPVGIWESVTLSMSLPVTLAAGMLYPPAIAGLIAFAGSLDVREFRGGISADRSLYNRSQVAMSVMGASLVFHATRAEVGIWPGVLLAGVLALVTDFVLNVALVAFPARTLARIPLLSAIQNMIAFPTLRQHLGSYLSMGLLSIALAGIVRSTGLWGIAAFAAPLLIARRELLQAARLEQAARKLNQKNQALLAAAERAADERRDERLAVAGELHDEVLPPLFKVHLMGQVIRRDLDSGRLLSLDEDLPQLLSATEVAQEAIRALVGDLRRSPLGTGGLGHTVRLLARELESQGSPEIEVTVSEELRGTPLAQLLAYQVAREAMTNSVRYSEATRIAVRVWEDHEVIRVVVEDDGKGFVPQDVDRLVHFGLQLIEERTEAAMGKVVVDSSPGGGTRVVAAIPRQIQ